MANPGIVLKPKIIKKKPVKVLPRDTEPPKHSVSSFGTEADSRRSWESLHPTPPRKNLAQMMKFDGKVLCFITKLIDDGIKVVPVNDKSRVFVFRYFLADDTMSIFEPPQRNSGFIGGKFLERGKHMNIDTDKFFAKDDFKLNGKIRICGRCFVVNELSTGQQHAGRKAIGANNMRAIITKVENKLRRHGSSLARTFRAIDEDKSNTVTYDEMKVFLKSYFSADELTDQEVFVVMRYFDSDGEGRIDYNEFAAKIQGKDVGANNYNTTSGADGGDTMATGNLGMSQAELDKYQAILVAAVEEDKKKAFLQRSMNTFRQQAEGYENHTIKNMFKVNDVNFNGTISYARFEALLAQQDYGGSNSGIKSFKMDKDAAKVVVAELFRAQGLTRNDPMSRNQFFATFAFSE